MLPGTRFLGSGGLERYHLDRALTFFLLQDALDTSPCETCRSTAGLPALRTVAGQSGAALVERGSSFFWHHVQTLYEGLSRSEPIAGERLDFFSTQLFDSFFPLLDDADWVALSGSLPAVVLPSLGLHLPTRGRPCRLTRLSPHRVGLSGEGLDLVADLDLPAAEHRLPAVSLTPTARLLFTIDSLLDDALACRNLADLSPGAGLELSEMLRQALEMIHLAAPAVAARMDSVVRWYFPIKTEDRRQVHNSFSVGSLHGVIFLSESYGYLPLAEGMVHELYHNELWMAMAVDRHLRHATDLVLYSPWRTDARHLTGLYHGIYVFTGLLEFFAEAGREPRLNAHHEHFAARRWRIFHQLRTALAQVRDDDLEPRGQEFIAAMREIVERQGRELGALGAAVPESQMTHWYTWCDRHPELSRLATPPAGADPVERVSQGGSR